MNTQTTKELVITALWWSVAFLLIVSPWIVSVLVFEEGWIRYAALPLSVILTITFGTISDKLSDKEEIVMESKVYEKGV